MSERATLYNEDNRDVYERVSAVNAIITDPPYAGVHDIERQGRDESGELKDGVPFTFDKLSPEDVLSLGKFAAANCKGWMLTFCQTEQTGEWASLMDSEKVRYFRPMLWIKPDAKPNFRGHGPGVGHENILSFWCGGGPQSWNGGGKVGVFYHTKERRSGKRHLTEKPVSLMVDLIRLFTQEDDIIFDPFMGCGSTGVAALQLNRRFIGVEKNREYFNEAKRRIEEAAKLPSLFKPEPTNNKHPTLLGDATFGSSNTKKMLRRKAKERAGN